jgi:membrane associated rhomboid family serine protease
MWNKIRTLPATLWDATSWYRRGILALWFGLAIFGFATGDTFMGVLAAVFGLMDCLWVLEGKAREDRKKAPVITYNVDTLSPNAQDFTAAMAAQREAQRQAMSFRRD